MTELQDNSRSRLMLEGFLPISGEYYGLFKEYEADSMLQEFTATVCMAGAPAYNAVFKVMDGYLCSAWFYQNGDVLFCVQRNERDVPAFARLQPLVDALFDLSLKLGLPFLRIYAVEERFLETYKAVEGYEMTYAYDEDWCEYVYKTGDLLELSGGVNFYKRKRLKKCFAFSDISLEPITKENIQECFEVEDEWCSHQDCESCGSFIGCDKKAFRVMAGVFDESIYTGFLLYHQKKPKGYIFCEKKDKNVVFLYFGKANIQDFFVYLIYMIVKTYFSDVAYFNIGPDIGKPGLRAFKKHLSGYELLRKYICTFTRND
jgi:hypothetical protein